MAEQEEWASSGPYLTGDYVVSGRGMRIVATCPRWEDALTIANDHNALAALQAELAAERERAMGTLRWTKATPTEIGWYWYDEWEDGTPAQVIHVLFREGKGLGVLSSSGHKWHPISSFSGWWYGPLEPPIRETHT